MENGRGYEFNGYEQIKKRGGTRACGNNENELVGVNGMMR